MREIIVHTDGRAVSTGPLMLQWVYHYCDDMIPWASCTLQEVFDAIKSIPFHPDPAGVEYLQRPYITMNSAGPGGDCDDKAICMGSWARLHEFPFEFVAVRSRKYSRLHHVYTKVYYMNVWVIADCTYPFNLLGQEREAYIERVVIARS